MVLVKYPKRTIELVSTEKSIQIPIGRSSRLPPSAPTDNSDQSPAYHSFKSSSFSRIEAVGNLYFNKRTVSRTHAYLKVDSEHKDYQGLPSLVIEDNGSQHGVVWEGKRIPPFTNVRLRNNQKVGFVYLGNKDYDDYSDSDDDSVLQNQIDGDEQPSNDVLDPDTIFFKPHFSWKSASLDACRFQLEFQVKQKINRIYLEVRYSDSSTSSKSNDNDAPESLAEDLVEYQEKIIDVDEQQVDDDDTKSVASLRLNEKDSDVTYSDFMNKNDYNKMGDSNSEVSDNESGITAMLYGEFESDESDEEYDYCSQESDDDSKDEYEDEYKSDGQEQIQNELPEIRDDHSMLSCYKNKYNYYPNYVNIAKGVTSTLSSSDTIINHYDALLKTKLEEIDVLADDDDDDDDDDDIETTDDDHCECGPSLIKISDETDSLYNELKRKLQESEDEDFDDEDSEYDPNEQLEQSNSDKESESNVLNIEAIEVESVQPNKRRKFDFETAGSSTLPLATCSLDIPNVSSSIKSHIFVGISGLAVGAAMTFAALASFGERYMENS